MSAIIFFDGVCNLCNGIVQLIIRHDAAGYFRFVPLQSEAARQLLAAGGHTLPPASADPDSVLVLEDGQLYAHSAAVLRIARHLPGWRWLAVGRLLPRAGRDALYRFVARHRYRWFGRQQECMLPTPELKARFLA